MRYVTDEGRRAVTLWLLVVAGMILIMLALGGLTRLTESGLSMVDWKPIMGTLPPLSHADWEAAFEAYKQFPEYQKHNTGMTLGEFEFIYSMEYGHRLLGRLIGLVFIIPFAVFWARGWLSPPMIRRCVLLFVLGGLQGYVGWFMVQSGLVDVPRVSQYRLTLHLALAILTFTLAIWFALDLGDPAKRAERSVLASLRGGTLWLVILIGAQILTGGFVAGLDAGKAFNTFPTMNGHWVPPGLFSIEPWFRNFFENPATVQLVHRWLALVVTGAVVWFFWHGIKHTRGTRFQRFMITLIVLLVIQVGLGISTLLLAVPIALASAHQVVAVLLWGTAIYLRHQATQS